MRALELDFVRRRPAWPAWGLLAIGVALAGDAALRMTTAQAALDDLQRAQAGPRAVAAAPKQPVSDQTRREFDAARRILQELALPWEPLFRTIEAALDRDTALLAIEPDAAKGALRLTGEARDYVAILRFMRRLEAAGVLGGVHLLSHQMREDVNEKPYQFILGASWRTAQ